MMALGRKVLAVAVAVAVLVPGSIVRADAGSPSNLALLVDNALQRAYQQLNYMDSVLPLYPVYTEPTGQWYIANASKWTSGFFPGSLWLAYELSGDAAFQQKAQNWTAGLESQKYNTSTHDIGFMIFNSFGNGYRLTGDQDYKDVVLTAAGSLAQRYNSTVGCIRSWGNKDSTTGNFTVIIDNMMNLELLFWASKNGGQQVWYDIALSHAERTMAEHVRPNGSSYHVVEFDTQTGHVNDKHTYQGYADWSTWSRGQAWGLYGFTMTYRETSDARFLATAQAMADYFVNNLPADHVPYWDFDAPGANPVRDSSAAAIACAGLFELCTLADDLADKQRYWSAGRDILASLCSDNYLCDGTQTDGILLHGTYHYHGATGVDASLVWGDYYFIEAMSRYLDLLIPGDLNGDGTVTLLDVLLLADAWGTCAGDPNYTPNADLNNDNCVNLPDLLILASHWGESI